MNALTEDQWQQYERDGYLKLGRLLSDPELAALQQRIDDIMLGRAKVDYDQMLMQLDGGGDDYSKTLPQTRGFKGPSRNYRKIEDLELDPLFLEFTKHPLARHICGRVYGTQTAIKCMRAMFMNKPARRGTVLPWHQDRWTGLVPDPLVTIWTALDPSNIDNGCMRIIPASHRKLLNPDNLSGFLSKEQLATLDESPAIHLELAAGESVLLHNWLLHSSDVNDSPQSRRAYSVCYMEAATKCCESFSRSHFNVLFGEGELTPETLGSRSAT